MKFDLLVEKLLKENLGTRVSSGSDEVRNILKSGKVRSSIYGGGGDTYFVDRDTPKWKYMPQNIANKEYGEKLGYVLRADRDKLKEPAERMYQWLFKHQPEEEAIKSAKDLYAKKGYKVLPADSPASDIKTIQRIIKDPVTGNYTFKEERDFARFRQIYDKLVQAYQRAGIKPPRISTPTTVAGLAAVNSMLLSELPPDLKNSFMARGGLGIKGKFEALP